MVWWVRIMLGGHSSRRIKMTGDVWVLLPRRAYRSLKRSCAISPCRLRSQCLIRLPWHRRAPLLLDSLIVPLIAFSSCPRSDASSSDCTALRGRAKCGFEQMKDLISCRSAFLGGFGSVVLPSGLTTSSSTPSLWLAYGLASQLVLWNHLKRTSTSYVMTLYSLTSSYMRYLQLITVGNSR